MRRLPMVIWLVVVLVAVVTGCGGAHRYDGRLMVADSLMRSNPDSALAILESLPVGSLTTEGDRAYHGLLLAQARYKAYVTATSDSDINRALSYYRAHSGEREKLTRAYIYKGAVMEELGHPDSAMYYYKSAEATADEKDYVNLGYINTRIADLYRRYYADEEICFDKFKRALHYHTLSGNKHLQQNCLYNMAMFASISKTDDPNIYLKQATELALELKDEYEYFQCQEMLCRQLLLIEDSLQQTKTIAMRLLKNHPDYINNDLLLDLADVYAKENNIDSSKYYLDYVDELRTNEAFQRIKVRKLIILALLAEKEGKKSVSNHCGDLIRHELDSINNNDDKYRIQNIENKNNFILSSQKDGKIKRMQWLIWTLTIFFIVILMIVAIYHYYKVYSIKSIIKELRCTHDVQPQLDRHQELLEQLDAKDTIIGQFVNNLATFMHTSIDASEKDPPSVIRKRIKETISDITDKNFWKELKTYLDRNYNNIISNIARNPKITDKDLKCIMLMCCRFDYLEIAITLGYTPKYISQKRKEIAKKLGLIVPLQEFLFANMGIEAAEYGLD